MEITKAVVLAADCRGPEPWPSLGLAARQLAPVGNRPVLFHHLDALTDAGVREAAIVTDCSTRSGIRDAVGDGSAWGLEVSYLDDDGGPNVLASPAIADFIGAASVLVHHADILLREPLSALEDHFADNGLDALVLHPSREGEPAREARASTGYIIGSDFHQALRREATARSGAGLDDVLARLRADGARIEVREVEACLPCRGGAKALLEANRHVLGELVPDQSAERVFGSEIQGPVALHPSAELRDSLVRGPVAIGPRASIANAYIGPYTSVGADVRIDCVEIEHSIVLDGAQIRFLGARIEGSLIGPGAQVVRDFRVPRAVRLSVGERAEIALS